MFGDDPRTANRRAFLHRAGGGFGALACAALAAEADEPLAPKKPPRPATAKSVIYLFMDGGPSHLELFDPKPTLVKRAGETLPASFGRIDTANGTGKNKLLAPKVRWRQHGDGGIWMSHLLPHLAQHADDLCVLRGCVADGKNHAAAMCQMNTGALFPGRPSLGAWAVYGLGTQNRSLPGFVILTDLPKTPTGGPPNWGAGFLPGMFQGAKLQTGSTPLPQASAPPELADPERTAARRRFLADLNKRHLDERAGDATLAARVQAMELAFRMQAEAPDAVDLTDEDRRTRTAYGFDNPKTRAVARNCLLARRLVERGVRFVQVYCGAGCGWDAHEDIEANHADRCREMDQPVAALLADLKQRGLLASTLVVWGGEFGRTPMTESTKGRDHNPWGFTCWLAGGGVRGGQTIGETDEFGLRAIAKPVTVHDFHATILAALGIDAGSLTFPHHGRDEKPTVDGGKPVTEAFA